MTWVLVSSILTMLFSLSSRLPLVTVQLCNSSAVSSKGEPPVAMSPAYSLKTFTTKCMQVTKLKTRHQSPVTHFKTNKPKTTRWLVHQSPQTILKTTRETHIVEEFILKLTILKRNVENSPNRLISPQLTFIFQLTIKSNVSKCVRSYRQHLSSAFNLRTALNITSLTSRWTSSCDQPGVSISCLLFRGPLGFSGKMQKIH